MNLDHFNLFLKNENYVLKDTKYIFKKFFNVTVQQYIIYIINMEPLSQTSIKYFRDLKLK